MAPGTDRRVRRTRALLHQALIELILEKGYGRITVQDILDRADVGRSTFYSHYRDKDTLLLDGGMDHLRTMIADAAAGAPVAPTPLHPARVIFRLADGNRRLYRALITVAFLVNGLMGLLTWWLDNKVPLTAEQMFDRFAQLATHGVKPLLQESPVSATSPPGPCGESGIRPAWRILAAAADANPAQPGRYR
jgi:AcrR family transcriptional regulator